MVHLTSWPRRPRERLPLRDGLGMAWSTIHSRVNSVLNTCQPSKDPVLVDGAILPAPAIPRISAIQDTVHPPVNMHGVFIRVF